MVPAAVERLAAIPRVELGHYPTPIDELTRLRAALGGGPRLLVKRDDAIDFGFGGNKVRKLRIVAARALAESADTLLTAGGLQSNHCRATAAAAAKLGLRCGLVVNGEPPARPSANALLVELLGAEIQYVATRADRQPALAAAADALRARGAHPYVIPVGASTPLGALAFADAIGEMYAQGVVPDTIVHATSSGGTQAGLIAGCAFLGLSTRVLGISADEPAPALAAEVRRILNGMEALLGLDEGTLAGPAIEIDDGFVGEGYGIPTPDSREAGELLARSEALLVDQTYTAKAAAGLIAYVRSGRLRGDQTILFWHTGGQVGVFA